MMKRIFFFLTLTLASLTTYATGQESEILYMDGVKWYLLAKPIYGDSVISRELKAALPQERGIVTSNWSGYTAHWSVQEEQLCLDSITYEIYKDKESLTKSLPSDVMRRLFKKYIKGKRIVAKWVDGDLRLGKGKVIYYQHSGFDRNYENERFVTVKQGKVCATKDFQNYMVDGFSFEDFYSRPLFDKNGKNEKKGQDLRKIFPLHIEQYPELADVERIVFQIKKARVDAQGHLVECEVKVHKPADNPRLALEMEEALKAYHPWRVSFINGEFRGYGIQGYVVPYLINEE
ncbi:MAG: hypothetical protein IJS97_03075 [Prevotella sp.]|nr:hypothetical protein [Prevotella sp.]